MVEGGEGVEGGLEALDEDGVPGEVEEGVGEGGRDAVASRDDDELGVAVEVPVVALGFGGLGGVGLEDVGEDVRLVGFFLWGGG